ncbi:MAG: AAA domain-containing protein [Thermodesulfobacteriota bacterium]
MSTNPHQTHLSGTVTRISAEPKQAPRGGYVFRGIELADSREGRKIFLIFPVFAGDALFEFPLLCWEGALISARGMDFNNELADGSLIFAANLESEVLVEPYRTVSVTEAVHASRCMKAADIVYRIPPDEPFWMEKGRLIHTLFVHLVQDRGEASEPPETDTGIGNAEEVFLDGYRRGLPRLISALPGSKIFVEDRALEEEAWRHFTFLGSWLKNRRAPDQHAEIEVDRISTRWGLKGRADCVFEAPGARFVVELKTGRTPISDHLLQLFAYTMLFGNGDERGAIDGSLLYSGIGLETMLADLRGIHKGAIIQGRNRAVFLRHAFGLQGSWLDCPDLDEPCPRTARCVHRDLCMHLYGNIEWLKRVRLSGERKAYYDHWFRLLGIEEWVQESAFCRVLDPGTLEERLAERTTLSVEEVKVNAEPAAESPDERHSRAPGGRETYVELSFDELAPDVSPGEDVILHRGDACAEAALRGRVVGSGAGRVLVRVRRTHLPLGSHHDDPSGLRPDGVPAGNSQRDSVVRAGPASNAHDRPGAARTAPSQDSFSWTATEVEDASAGKLADRPASPTQSGEVSCGSPIEKLSPQEREGRVRGEDVEPTCALKLAPMGAQGGGDHPWYLDKIPFSKGPQTARHALFRFLEVGEPGVINAVVNAIPQQSGDGNVPASIAVSPHEPVAGDEDLAFGEGLTAELNDDQQAAVIEALDSEVYHLIHGPPGTGKTRVLARLAKLCLDSGERLLIACPTNVALDRLLISLMDLGVRDFIRVGGRSVVSGDFLEALDRHGRPAVLLDDLAGSATDCAAFRRMVRQTRLIGATAFQTVSHPMFCRQEFDRVIVDEAGQLDEPSALGPLALGKRVVLGGDHLQLPPVVQARSEDPAQPFGMERSLFERLFESGPAPRVSALTVQYRMNREVQDIPSRLFYGGSLVPSAEAARRRLSLNVGLAPNSEMTRILDPANPVVFVDVPGPDSGKARPEEARKVAEIVEALLLCGVPADQVGIITPYRAQQSLIRAGMPESAKKISVDTVDRFQGGEREVIILSLARSDNVTSFLADRKRLNVSLSRARSKLVLLGHGPVLDGHALFSAILEGVTRIPVTPE